MRSLDAIPFAVIVALGLAGGLIQHFHEKRASARQRSIHESRMRPTYQDPMYRIVSHPPVISRPRSAQRSTFYDGDAE